MTHAEIIAKLHHQEGRAAAMATLLVALLRTHPNLESVLREYRSEREAQGSLGLALPVSDTVLVEMERWSLQFEHLVEQSLLLQRDKALLAKAQKKS